MHPRMEFARKLTIRRSSPFELREQTAKMRGCDGFSLTSCASERESRAMVRWSGSVSRYGIPIRSLFVLFTFLQTICGDS